LSTFSNSPQKDKETKNKGSIIRKRIKKKPTPIEYKTKPQNKKTIPYTVGKNSD
jgi:hypothetical protein